MEDGLNLSLSFLFYWTAKKYLGTYTISLNTILTFECIRLREVVSFCTESQCTVCSCTLQTHSHQLLELSLTAMNFRVAVASAANANGVLGEKSNDQAQRDTQILWLPLRDKREQLYFKNFILKEWAGLLDYWEWQVLSRVLGVITAQSSLLNVLPPKAAPEGIFLLASRLHWGFLKRHATTKGRMNWVAGLPRVQVFLWWELYRPSVMQQKARKNFWYLGFPPAICSGHFLGSSWLPLPT